MNKANRHTVVLLLALAMAAPATATFHEPITETAQDLRWALPPESGGSWEGVAALDLDGDGDDELIAGNLGSLKAFEGDLPVPLWTTPTAVQALRVADLDDDGRPEVITYGARQPIVCGPGPVRGVYVWDALTGAPLGAYEANRLAGLADDLEITDLDRDGVQDILLTVDTPRGTNHTKRAQVIALDGRVMLSGGGPTGLGVAGEEAVAWVFHGGFTFITLPALAATELPWAEQSMVYFSDRLATDTIYALDGTTGAVIWTTAGPSSDAIELADMNNDGRLNVLTNPSREIQVHHAHNGTLIRTYDPEAEHPHISRQAHGTLALHLNDDNQPDLVTFGIAVLNEDVPNDRIIWAIDGATGSILWTASLGPLESFMHPPALKAGDLDGDGDMELIVTQGDTLYAPVSGVFHSHHARVSVLDPDTGRFLWEQWLPSSVAEAFVAADVDGDGDNEVVTASASLFAVWDPTFSDLGDRIQREEGIRSAHGAGCMFN